jgi:hypothetical protein
MPRIAFGAANHLGLGWWWASLSKRYLHAMPRTTLRMWSSCPRSPYRHWPACTSPDDPRGFRQHEVPRVWPGVGFRLAPLS